jgi:hypothetical protein
MQAIAQSIQQGEGQWPIARRLAKESQHLRHFRRLVPDSDHGRQAAQPILPHGIPTHPVIGGQADKEVSRAIGQRTQDRLAYPEIVGVAPHDVREELGLARPANLTHRQRKLVAHVDGRIGGQQPELAPERVRDDARLDQPL